MIDDSFVLDFNARFPFLAQKSPDVYEAIYELAEVTIQIGLENFLM